MHLFSIALRARFVLPALLWLAVFPAAALDLPSPDKLEQDSHLQRQPLDVAEPHASTAGHPVNIGYVGLPMDALLTHWFGEGWKASGTEVVYIAKDGYRSAVPAAKLQAHRAFLAFARADGKPFEVDNREQNEKVPLGPYYLVWDNLKSTELFSQGSAGWPYQVVRIELHRQGDDDALLPPKADSAALLGLPDTKANCLTCHKLRGIGGNKYPQDLVQALCRWNAEDLARWIDNPAKLRPGTTMPALNRMKTEEERQAMVTRVVNYLMAMKRADLAACAEKP